MTLHHLFYVVALGSIIGDIGHWLSAPFRGAKDLAGAVWKAVKHLWSTVAGVFHHVGGAWSGLLHSIHALDVALAFLADSTRNALTWTIHHLNPKSVAHSITKAVSWARREIGKLAHSVRGRFAGVYRWARHQVNSVGHRLSGVFRFLHRKVNTALHWIGHQGKRVWHLLSSPARLAAYVAAALITPLFRYIVGHIEALALMIGRWMLANIGKLAVDLERAVARIF